jgi:hypothetical protein
VEDAGANGRMILKWILKKYDRGRRLDSFGLQEGQVTGCSENGSERSGYVKCEEFLE